MDPLSVAASIAGLVTAAGELAKILKPYISAAGEAVPKIAVQVHAEVQSSRTIIIAVEKLTRNLGSVKNTSLIQVDQVVAVLTDGVLLFSELEDAVGSLLKNDTSRQRLPLRSRLQWARKEGSLGSLLVRLQGFKSSINLILTILQSDSDLRAAQQQSQLAANIDALLESNQALCSRLMNLEAAFDGRTMAAETQSLVGTVTQPAAIAGQEQQQAPDSDSDEEQSVSDMSHLTLESTSTSLSSLSYETDLEASWVYRRAVKRSTMDFSMRSSVARSHAWSMFSGLSLGDVSVIAVIELPLYFEDLANPQHYNFGNGPQPRRELAKDVTLDRSVYHDCLEIKAQLKQLPGFPQLFQEAQMDGEEDRLNPMQEIGSVFRLGFPLLMLFNEVEHRWEAAAIKSVRSQRSVKVAIFRFLNDCADFWRLDHSELFVVNDLMGGSNIGFLKVLPVLDLVLATLRDRGVVQPVKLAPRISAHQGVDEDEAGIWDLVEEFLSEERLYVRDLQTLLEMKDIIAQDEVFGGYQLHEVFGPLSRMVENQINFLMTLEVIASHDIMRQRWKIPFEMWQQAVGPYAVFIVHEQKNREILRSRLSTMDQRFKADDAVQSALSTCLRLLPTPFLLLARYNRFLRNMTAFAGTGSPLKATLGEELNHATVIVQMAITQIDDLIKEGQLDEALADLTRRVRDWKGNIPGTFGKLLLFDRLWVAPSITTSPARLYHAYLFERILITCKELTNPAKPANGWFVRRKRTPTSVHLELILKGRVFCKNMTDVVVGSKPGAHECTVVYENMGETSESFTMTFRTAAQLQLWSDELKKLSSKAKEGSQEWI